MSFFRKRSLMGKNYPNCLKVLHPSHKLLSFKTNTVLWCTYLPSRATEMIDESVLYDKLESKLISLHALIGTATKRTSRVKRGAFRNKIQRVAKRKYPACIKQVVTTTSLSPVPPRCRVNQLSLLSILSCIWLVTWENKLHINTCFRNSFVKSSF